MINFNIPGLKILMRATSPQTENISATDSMVGLSIGRFSTSTVLERAEIENTFLDTVKMQDVLS